MRKNETWRNKAIKKMGNIDVSLNRERNISEFSGKEQIRTDCFPKETINYKPTGTTCKEI